MFSSSARRIAFNSSFSYIAPNHSKASSRIVSSQARPFCTHQRCSSSSKPTAPANGPKRVTDGQEIPASSERSKTEGEKKASSRSSRRREKDGSTNKGAKGKDDEAIKGVSNLLKGTQRAPSMSASVEVEARNKIKNLPKLQNANPLDPKEFDASSFFALHRPIAVGAGFPPPVTDAAFKNLFIEQPKTSETSEIITNLARTFRRMNYDNKPHLFSQSHLVQMNAGNREEELLRRTEELRASLRLDPSPSSVPHHLDGNLQSRPLPLPSNMLQKLPRSSSATGMKIMLPLSTPESTMTSASTGRQSLLLNIKLHKDTLPNGDQVLTPYHAQLIEQRATPLRLPSAYRQRVAQRRERSIQRIQERIEALSVKRLRKLRMKKKKYKKLQKRTRTLRRKLERSA